MVLPKNRSTAAVKIDKRDKILNLLESLSRWSYRHPFKVLISAFLFLGALILQIPSLAVDTTSEALLHKDDPSLLAYNRFRDQFGQSELIIITIEAPTVFQDNFIHRLKSFHAELESEVPYLEKITSLINIRNTYSKNDTLFVEELLANWPQRNFNLQELKQQVLNNPFYLNHVISKDGHITAVVIETTATVGEIQDEDQILSEFEPDVSESQKSFKPKHYFSAVENREVVKAVNRVVTRYHSDSFRLRTSGGPIIIDAFNRETMRDLRLLFACSLLAVAFFLWILFQRLSGVTLPLLITNASLFSTLGIMALFNVPIKLPTTIIPAFIIVVGVCDSVHILAIFYRYLERGAPKEEAVAFTFMQSGFGKVFSSLTTIAGLLSFSFAELSAIAEIGYFSAAGVMLALIYTIIMLPALLALTRLKQTREKSLKRSFVDEVLRAVADLATRHPRRITIISLGIFAIFLPPIFNLHFSYNPVEYLPDHMPYRSDLKYIDRELKGTLTLEIEIDTGRENGVQEPWVLNQIDQVSRDIARTQRDDILIGKVFSVTDILKEIHQALNEGQKSFYTIPQQRDVIFQEFLLFENSGADDLGRIVDSQFKKTRMTIKISWTDAIACRYLIQDVRRHLQNIFKGKFDISITGMVALLARTISAATYSLSKSYLIALLAITTIMIFFIGDLKIGLIGMVPNLVPIIIIMGSMGYMNIPLDLNSLMIGSIALGILVDDTVHFIYNFKRYYDKSGDPYFAIQKTLLGVGRALLITSLVLSSGFFIFMWSSLKHLFNFGLFTGLAILLAVFADFFLAPALMIIVNPNRQVKVQLSESS